MADFEKVISFIVKTNEGGLNTSKSDAGNYRGFNKGVGLLLGTNHGISGALLCELYPGLSDVQIKSKIINMTFADAVFIYKKEFWNGSNLDSINNNSIAYQFMDHYINAGPVGFGKLAEIMKSKYNFFSFSRVASSQKPFKKSLTALEIKSINSIENEVFYKDLQFARINAYPGTGFLDNKERPLRWRYEKKKSKPKPKAGIKSNNSIWDWLSTSFNNKKFKI